MSRADELTAETVKRMAERDAEYERLEMVCVCEGHTPLVKEGNVFCFRPGCDCQAHGSAGANEGDNDEAEMDRDDQIQEAITEADGDVQKAILNELIRFRTTFYIPPSEKEIEQARKSQNATPWTFGERLGQAIAESLEPYFTENAVTVEKAIYRAFLGDFENPIMGRDLPGSKEEDKDKVVVPGQFIPPFAQEGFKDAVKEAFKEALDESGIKVLLDQIANVGGFAE